MSSYASSIKYRCRETRAERIHTFCQTWKSADRQCAETAARRQHKFGKQIRSRRTEAGGRRTDFRVCKPQIRWSGEGSNCKNIVLHILEYLIGNYAVTITPALSLP